MVNKAVGVGTMFTVFDIVYAAQYMKWILGVLLYTMTCADFTDPCHTPSMPNSL